ncbi:excisionase family DNA binding protein [Saccharomonospora amisosensis]|uniref:Excisionase family DNA binding protein n=2 Tax=Saccharomonospora amisosensis TaxID=1128677 RepID=A0A7X5UNU4_9PSEU|nr:excisionase family DNA binding protein [Saccharomonospora amisosensis]
MPGHPPPQAQPRGELASMGTQRQHLTIADICQELGISRRTFYEWRAKKRAPRCIKLPNGDLRIRRTDLEAWLESREEAA